MSTYETETKEAARAEARVARRRALSVARAELSSAACTRIIDSTEWKEASCVFVYMATEYEIDCAELIDGAFAERKIVCVPSVTEDGMVAVAISQNSQFICGKYGIKTPVWQSDDIVSADRIDLAVVPMVGFDEDCNRLGAGGGYYDRYLATATQTFRFGLACEAQKIRFAPLSHDVPMDAVATELRVYRRD